MPQFIMKKDDKRIIEDKDDDYNIKKDKSVLGATLAPSSSWAELQVGAKVDQY